MVRASYLIRSIVGRETFENILLKNGGAGPGFDLLRLVLAIAILLAHIAGLLGTSGIIPSTINFFLSLIGHARAAGDEVIRTAPNLMVPHTGLTRPIVLTHVPMFF